MITRMRKWGIRGLALLPLTAFPPAPLLSQAIPPQIHRAVIVWRAGARGEDSLDQLSLDAVFASLGLRAQRIPPEEIARQSPGSGTVLIIPHASAAHLGTGETRDVIARVSEGMALVTDGTSPLASGLGIHTGRREPVDELTDVTRPELPIVWPGRQTAAGIEGYPRRGALPVYTEKRLGRPLAIILKYGEGACLYFAPLVDPHTAMGYSRFPTLPAILTHEMGCRPLLTRRGADAYFDPGYRVGRSPEELAGLWKSWGIRAVHIAAWYVRGTPPCDYAGFIGALHRHGLLAYAWLEWPYVGKDFWDTHPQWRQKNALLQDAHLDFLYLMDLQNAACMAAALKELEELLDLDWDGVDVAEFTLTGAGREALEGPAMPEFFTGFTETGRRGFSAKSGFDPLELFEPRSHRFWKTDTAGLAAFYRYRTEVNYDTERRLFADLREADRAKKRSREMMLTIVDNTLHPEFDRLLGFDMNETVAVTREFALTLDVEDPYTEWSRPPERYTGVRSSYRKLLGGRPFMIDVNVVPLEEDRKGSFSTAQPAGTEFLQLAHYGSGDTGRVCFYCESSVYEKDWQLLPFALASAANVKAGPGGDTVEAPYTVTLRMDAGKYNVTVDGVEWPARSDSDVTVPRGHHVIRIESGMDAGGIRLLSLTGELEGATRAAGSLAVAYQSAGRCALEFDMKPGGIEIDGKTSEIPIYDSAGGCVIPGPPGKHTITLHER
jgi:hypothetical protein